MVTGHLLRPWPESDILIFNTLDPKIRRSLIAVAVLNIVLNIPQLLMVWFQCTPVNSLWNPLKQADCDHRKSVYYTYFVGAIAALSDFYLAIVPIHMLIPLRIDRKLKWGLSFLMGLGIFAGVAAIVRTWAAKFILDVDSSCKNLLYPSIQIKTNIFLRWSWSPLSMGRGRRVDCADYHVHPTCLASFPSFHFPLYQLHIPKSASVCVQEPIWLSAIIRIDSCG